MDHRLTNPETTMNRPSHLRRTLFALALSLLSLPFAGAQAPAYPTRAVSIIVGTDPGGAPDILARLLATRLSDKLGKQFIVENKPGAAGMVGARLAAGAAADGHTLFLGTVATNAIVASAYKHPGGTPSIAATYSTRVSPMITSAESRSPPISACAASPITMSA